ncbi:MAG: PilZ domain-containing protein [Acidobacteriia bacterium]|nr:PilZ domain-containing protein [Terriglobia bacterium]
MGPLKFQVYDDQHRPFRFSDEQWNLIRNCLITGHNRAATEQQSETGGEGFEGMGSPGASASMGRVLLVCDDSAAIQQLAEGMQQLAIATEVCVDVNMALALLRRKKFEAVIIDFGLPEADQVLGQARLSPSNRTAVTFAITDPSKSAKSEIQANFLMEKPLSASSVGRTLKAAFGLIVRERRRSFRCPTETSATLLTNGEEINCRLINISEGGMAVTGSPAALKSGAQVRVMFMLPGESVRLKIDAEVCWRDESGRAGLRSLMIPSEQRSVLQRWLAAKLEEDLPESVAQQFRK